MSIPRKRALLRIAGLSERIVEHVRKVQTQPLAASYNHWRFEALEWCEQVEALARHVGERTQSEVLPHVEDWKQALIAENERRTY